MKKIISAAFLFVLFSFSLNGFAATPVYKYSCDDPQNNYGGKCPDPSYKFTDPAEAAQSVIVERRAYYKALYGNLFINYPTQYPTCTYWDPNSSQYYLLRCTYNSNLQYYEADGVTRSGPGWKEEWVFILREHPCEFNISLKGTVGAVSPPNDQGKRYVMVPGPVDPVCANACNYSVKAADKCYLSIGSDNEGFCNYNFILILDNNGLETRCATDPSVKPAEVGDELSDKCPEGLEFANGSKMCTPIPCPEGYERLEGSETCTAIPNTGGGTGGHGGTGGGTGGDGGTGGGTGGDGGDGGTGGGTGGDGGTGGGTGGDGGTGGGTGGDGGTGGGTGGDGGTGGGTGGDGGTGGGTGGDGGTGGGTGGDGGTDDEETFTPPGPLDLSASVAGRGEQAKSQIIDMKQKMVASNTFTAAKSAFSGSSHAAAVCPVGSVTLFSKEIVFDSHCKLFGLIAPILKAVFIAIWSFLAVRIVLTA